MTDVPFVPIIDATEISIGDVPFCASKIFFPVLDSIVVLVTRIFPPRWVGFTCINNAVSVGILFAIVKCVIIGVVVPWVRGLCRVTVSPVDFNTIRNAIAVGIRACRVGEQCQCLIGIVEAIVVRVTVLRIRRGYSVNFSSECRTSAWTNPLNWVAR